MLLAILRDEILQAVPQARISATCRNAEPLSALGIEPHPVVPRYQSRLLNMVHFIRGHLRALRRHDLGIFGGGTQIKDTGKNSWKGNAGLAGFLVLNRLFFRRPVLHLCVGVGRHESALGRFFARLIIRCSDYFLVRDAQSAEWLRRLGCPESKLSVGYDPAYLMYEAREPKAAESNGALRIGVSLLPYYGYDLTDPARNREFQTLMTDFVRWLLEAYPQCEIDMFALQGSHGNDDVSFLRRISEAVASPRIACHPYSPDFRATLERMARLDLAVGMRLHFLLLANMLHVPAVALAYEDKVRYQAAAIGMERHCLDLDGLSQEQLRESFCRLHSSAAEIRAELAERMRTVSKDLESLRRNIRKAILDHIR